MPCREEKPEEGRTYQRRRSERSGNDGDGKASAPCSPQGEDLRREVEIEYYRSGGPGGQKKNKTETAVRLRHIATGIVVTASERRSRRENLKIAFARLRLRIEATGKKRKVRRPTAPPRAVQECVIETKRRRSNLKRSRRKVAVEDEDH